MRLSFKKKMTVEQELELAKLRLELIRIVMGDEGTRHLRTQQDLEYFQEYVFKGTKLNK